MMKFAGKWDIDWKETFKKGKSRSDWQELDIPTVDEVDEFNSPCAADTILQILRGQGIYWGYDVESFADNEIQERAPEKIQVYKPSPPKISLRISARIEAKRIKLERDVRKLAERVMEQHWRIVEKAWLKSPENYIPREPKLTRKQRFFYQALLAQGYNKDSAFALAKQFLPTTKEKLKDVVSTARA